jgi:hypothetical protein
LHHGLLRPSRPLLVGAAATGAGAVGASSLSAAICVSESGRAIGWRILRALCGLSEDGEAALEAEAESDDDDDGDGFGGGDGDGAALPLTSARARSLLRGHVVVVVEAQSRAQAQAQAGAGPAADTEEAGDAGAAGFGPGAVPRDDLSPPSSFAPPFRPGHAANAPALRYLSLPEFQLSSQVRRERESATDMRASAAYPFLPPLLPRPLLTAERLRTRQSAIEWRRLGVSSASVAAMDALALALALASSSRLARAAGVRC